MIALHLRAPNDRNGNPRRLYLILSTSGAPLAAFDEGYKGRDACPVRARDRAFEIHVACPELEIPVREYQRILRAFASKNPDGWVFPREERMS